MVNEKI